MAYINRWSGYGVQHSYGKGSGRRGWRNAIWSSRVNPSAKFAPVNAFTFGYSQPYEPGRGYTGRRHLMLKDLGSLDPYIMSHWGGMTWAEKHAFLKRMSSLSWWNRQHPMGTPYYVHREGGNRPIKKSRAAAAPPRRRWAGHGHGLERMDMPPVPEFHRVAPPRPPRIRPIPPPRSPVVFAPPVPARDPVKAKRRRRTELQLLKG